MVSSFLDRQIPVFIYAIISADYLHEDLCKFFQQDFLKLRCTGKDITICQISWFFTFPGPDHASCFSDNNGSCRIIPGFQVTLKITMLSSTCHIAHIKLCGTCPSEVPAFHKDIIENRKQILCFGFRIWRGTVGNHSVPEMLCGRSMNK